MTILPFPDRRREVHEARGADDTGNVEDRRPHRTGPPLVVRIMALPWIVAFAVWFSVIDALVGPDDDDYTGRYD